MEAAEAYAIGLANRLVPKRQARAAAERLAKDLAAFPQTCLRNDRLSVYEQQGSEPEIALAREFALGLETFKSGEPGAGARRFANSPHPGGREER
ncbi:MAG: hypothetical protein ACREHF_11125 [Rhizomicrobium sp.]